jgi:Sec-independent protein translocase protein TatA
LGTRVPDLGKALGESIHGLKKALHEDDDTTKSG